MFNKKKPNLEKNVRDLLRENLNLIEIDMFYIDDPILGLSDEKRRLYLKTFFDLYKDKKLFERIRYHINKQAQKTLAYAKDGIQDIAGASNINGLAYIMDDIEKLANMYIKETSIKEEKPLDKFSIIPEVG